MPLIFLDFSEQSGDSILTPDSRKSQNAMQGFYIRPFWPSCLFITKAQFLNLKKSSFKCEKLRYQALISGGGTRRGLQGFDNVSNEPNPGDKVANREAEWDSHYLWIFTETSDS
jgi:hypothetical protein